MKPFLFRALSLLSLACAMLSVGAMALLMVCMAIADQCGHYCSSSSLYFLSFDCFLYAMGSMFCFGAFALVFLMFRDAIPFN